MLSKPINAAVIMMSKAQVFVKVVPVRAIQMAHPFTLTTKEGIQNGQVGDYLCEAIASKERWICPRSIFEEVYVPQNQINGYLQKFKHDA